MIANRIGRWNVLARELGRNDVNVMALVDPKSSRFVEEFHFSHSQADGLARLTQKLQERGYNVPEPPKNLKLRRPSSVDIIKSFFKFKSPSHSSPLPWKSQTTATPNLAQVSWHTWSPDETQELRTRALNKKVSENSLILYFLNKLLSEELLISPPMGFCSPWLFPINMRGPLEKEDTYKNVVSFISLALDSNMDLEHVHQHIKAGLQGTEAWMQLYSHSWGTFLPKSTRIKLMRRAWATQFWMGTYSDMGRWSPPGGPPGDQDLNWVFAPPGSENFPVGFVHFEWFNKKCFSLKIHPSITDLDPIKCGQELLSKLKKKILSL